MPSPDSLECKALSDLDLAQRMARREPSGHDLATAMCLAQQSLEKMLKSVVAMFCEGARLGDGNAVARSLGHSIYPKMVNQVHCRVERVKAPHFTADGMSRLASGTGAVGAGHATRIYGQIARHWGCFAESDPLQDLAWKASMGAADGGELSRVGSWLACHTACIERIIGAPAAGWHKIKNPAFVPPPMEKIVRDRARIEALRRASDMEPESAGRRALFSRGHRLNMARLGPQMSESHDPSLEPYGEFAKRSALEFWFQSVMLYHGVYMFVFPHNTLGRYPTAISGGLFTTDLYRSQIDYALYQIFVHVPCLVAELQHNSECLARLLGCGKDMGYW